VTSLERCAEAFAVCQQKTPPEEPRRSRVFARRSPWPVDAPGSLPPFRGLRIRPAKKKRENKKAGLFEGSRLAARARCAPIARMVLGSFHHTAPLCAVFVDPALDSNLSIQTPQAKASFADDVSATLLLSPSA